MNNIIVIPPLVILDYAQILREILLVTDRCSRTRLLFVQRRERRAARGVERATEEYRGMPDDGPGGGDVRGGIGGDGALGRALGPEDVCYQRVDVSVSGPLSLWTNFCSD